MRVNRQLLRKNAGASREVAPLTVWGVMCYVIQSIALLAIAAFFWALYGPSFNRGAELKRANALIEAEIASLRIEEQRLTRDIEGLTTDPVFVAREARDRLNLAKPTEVVFRFEPYQPGTPKRTR